MVGEGFAMDAIQRIKANEALKKKRGYYKSVDRYLHEDKKLKLRFRKISPDKLDNIKAGIRAQAKQRNKKQLIAAGVIFILAICCIIWAISIIQ